MKKFMSNSEIKNSLIFLISNCLPMKLNSRKFLIFAVLIVITSAAPKVLLLNLTSSSSLGVLSPLLNRNLSFYSTVANLNSDPELDLNS